MNSKSIDWLRRGAAGLRSVAPYAAIELLLPGGSLMALGLWALQRRAKRKAAFHQPDTQ